jgi:Gpi18-like mannosyltransferase
MNLCLVNCIIRIYCAEFIYKKTQKHVCNRKMISYFVIYEYMQVLLYTGTYERKG